MKPKKTQSPPTSIVKDVQNTPTIEVLKVADLIPFARNSRTHSDEQVAQIAGSIREFGFTNPVLIDSAGTIIAGHGRVRAASKLSMETVPCIRLEHLSPAQVRAYVIADNKLALNAGWDDQLLASEISALTEDGFDIKLLGFNEAELADLIAGKECHSDVDADAQMDNGDELCEKWGVEPGQVWELGNHKIACGDSTNPDVVTRLLGSEAPHLMVTDPPYGVEYDANWRNEAMREDGTPSDGRAVGKVLNDDRSDWGEAWSLFPGSVAYVWHAGVMAGSVQESLVGCGFKIRSQIIWAKQQFAIGRGDYHWQHEPCWYAVKDGEVGHYNGDRTQSTLWQIDKPQKSETGHSTQKPVECMERPIRNNSNIGDLVYEPFSGSGTTIIACERTGRKCRAIELNPAYVAVAIQRWADATGKEPTKL